MWIDRIIVLKFGSSILHCDDAVNDAVAEIYRHLRRGKRVVAVVSAIGETTDDLLRRLNRWNDVPVEAAATMLATGELASASILVAALRRDGIESRLLTPHQIHLRTEGPATEADPIGIRAEAIHEALDVAPVAIVPGFIGIGEDDGYTLLGRGGSDLSAVFIAQAIGAERCVLIKDVDGLFERDPNSPAPPPRRYASITWSDAAKLDRQIMQPRAVQFGRDHDFPFEVAGLNSRRSTRVGHASTSLTESAGHAGPLRIALLGLGTVGRGVFDHLQQRPEIFELAGIAVRDVERHAKTGIERELLTDDWRQLVRSDVDVVIELLGGTEVARDAVRGALRLGKHVVTANKALVERHGRSLRRLARSRGVCLLYSAAVGGAAPMLEAVRSIAKTGHVVRLEGVLNGTCNFILERLAEGASMKDAIGEAQRRGLAEADPTEDLDGSDAARKLCLLIRAAGVRPPRLAEIPKCDLRHVSLTSSSLNGGGAACHRQVASSMLDQSRASALVAVVSPSCNHAIAHLFGRVCGEWNALRVEDSAGNSWTIRGKGAGRWPTARSVLADLLDISHLCPRAVSPGVKDTGNHTTLRPVRVRFTRCLSGVEEVS